ncbi:MAG: septum formation initiator family protein [Bullifex sp.]
MTIKKLLLICLSFLIFSVVLTAVFSQNGYLVNRSLRARYNALKQREELYEVRLRALERQMESLDETGALDDLALSLGYNREGEKVFYFDSPDEETTENRYAEDPLPEVYGGVKTYVLLLIAAGLTVPIAVFLLVRGNGGKDEDDTAGRNDYENYDF